MKRGALPLAWLCLLSLSSTLMAKPLFKCPAIRGRSVMPTHAEYLSGTVIGVTDGDTLTLAQDTDRQHIKIRLADIDAPETYKYEDEYTSVRAGQPFGEESKHALTQVIKNRYVYATCYESDHWERKICTVFLEGNNINHWMIAQGWAWANRANSRYVRDPAVFQLEHRACLAQRGLWHQEQHPLEPWIFRKNTY